MPRPCRIPQLPRQPESPLAGNASGIPASGAAAGLAGARTRARLQSMSLIADGETQFWVRAPGEDDSPGPAFEVCSRAGEDHVASFSREEDAEALASHLNFQWEAAGCPPEGIPAGQDEVKEALEAVETRRYWTGKGGMGAPRTRTITVCGLCDKPVEHGCRCVLPEGSPDPLRDRQVDLKY